MGETLTSLLSNVTAVITEAFDWVVLAGSAIVDSPVLFVFAIAVPLVGLGVGLFRRLAGNL